MKSPSMERCVNALRQGEPVLCLIDDTYSGVRGLMILSAEKATPAGVNMLAREGKGVVCVGIDAATARRFDLAPMVPAEATAIGVHSVSTVSIDARDGITTGISAADRAVTLRLLTDDTATSEHFVRPGHLFPYVAHEHGVLGQEGAAEAAVDLMRIAGLKPAGAFCGVLDEDGRVADAAYLYRLADRAGLALITMKELVDYRLLHDSYMVRTAKERIETGLGSFGMETYADSLNQDTHYVLTAEKIRKDATPVYVHTGSVKHDVFGAKKSKSEKSLRELMQEVQEQGGLLIYVGSRTNLGARSLAVAAQLIAKSGPNPIRLLSGDKELAARLCQIGVEVEGWDGGRSEDSFGENPREAMPLLR